MYDTFLPIKRLTGECKQKKMIGQGGCGRVFQGSYNETEVVVKQNLNIDTINARELLFHSIIEHRNIIKCFGVYVGPSLNTKEYKLLFEFAQYGDLSNCYKDDKIRNMIENQKINLANDVLKGLEYIHSFSIVHRDIKIENILISNDDNNKRRLKACICDFGISTIKQKLNQGGNEGTINYLSPQMMNNFFHISRIRINTDEKDDIYSIGYVLWSIYYQSVPYSGLDEQTIKLYKKNDFEFQKNWPEGIEEDKNCLWYKNLKNCWKFKAKNRKITFIENENNLFTINVIYNDQKIQLEIKNIDYDSLVEAIEKVSLIILF
eukprot:TRINITY_DN4211_c0_g3_i2.p1 TRINITY_DN4211_c0_g3~~TRINITY_DN4211_c0_g3_i2.p1  ORF type:complete len:320 (-),score=59.37 TRINITY_DN4211_c0_g3_i2:4-963(-)